MEILQQTSLQPYNTFGLNQKAAFFCAIHTLEDFETVRKHTLEHQLPYLILGGGSNILLTQDFEGIALKNNLLGKRILEETNTHAIVEAAAGENWHEFVLWTLDNGYFGLENLSLIPGCVGAAPMQNIGAYGVEIKDHFHSLDAVRFDNGKTEIFNNSDCNFGYRESVFKRALKNQHLITAVRFQLSKTPQLKTGYGAIQEELANMQITEPTPKDVSNAVINIRRSKLPDPKKLGNAGSFFKNPMVPNSQAEKLKSAHPNIPVYPIDEQQSKLAAGWLIEQAGWKGKTIDNRLGVHKMQALVLVHYKNATGQEVWQLSEDIKNDVMQKFGVELEREVNIL